MFGGAFNFFGGQQQGGQRETPRGNTVVIDLEATLEQLYDGHSIEVRNCSECTEMTFNVILGIACQVRVPGQFRHASMQLPY